MPSRMTAQRASSRVPRGGAVTALLLLLCCVVPACEARGAAARSASSSSGGAGGGGAGAALVPGDLTAVVDSSVVANAARTATINAVSPLLSGRTLRCAGARPRVAASAPARATAQHATRIHVAARARR